MFSVWIDADSCPKQVRTFVLTATRKHSVPLYLVANRLIPLSSDSDASTDEQNKHVHMIVCEQTAQAADQYIFSHCEHDDIVITRDIPFAASLVEKGILVMNDRGNVFTKENIGERLSERNFMMNLEAIGLGSKKKKSDYGKKEFDKFCRAFDKDFMQKVTNWQYRMPTPSREQN